MTLRFIPVPGEDICAGKHGGEANSAAANARTNKARDAARIMAHVHQQGMHGATADEVEIALAMLPQTVSARFADLKKSGDLLKTGERRLTRAGRCYAAVCVTRGVLAARAPEQQRLL
jgi:hypothetical protein